MDIDIETYSIIIQYINLNMNIWLYKNSSGTM